MANLVYDILSKGAKKSYYSATYRPRGSIVFLTYRCTSRCTACNIWKRPVDQSDELDWLEWKAILENMFASGVTSVELFGGDALLRKSLLYNMIRFCKENNVATYFPTNSSSINKETAKELVAAGLGTIYFSLDETDEIDGSVRGVKRHENRVKKSIELLKKARGNSKYPKIYTITTVSSQNYKHLYKFAQIARDAGAEAWELRGITEFRTNMLENSKINGVPPEPYYVSTNDNHFSFNDSEAEEMLEMINNILLTKNNYLPMHVHMTNLQGIKKENLTSLLYPKHTCLFCTTIMVVSPYGNVMPCPFFNKYHLGNLTEKKASDVWGNAKHREFVEKQRNDQIEMCESCSIKHYHKGFFESAKEVMWLTEKRAERKLASDKKVSKANLAIRDGLEAKPVELNSDKNIASVQISEKL